MLPVALVCNFFGDFFMESTNQESLFSGWGNNQKFARVVFWLTFLYFILFLALIFIMTFFLIKTDMLVLLKFFFIFIMPFISLLNFFLFPFCYKFKLAKVSFIISLALILIIINGRFVFSLFA